jgi:DNA polymerase III subunit delta
MTRATIEQMITTITGANDLQRRAALQERITAFAAEYGDVTIERYDGEDTDAARMRESVASLPFLSARKLVVLREPGKQKSFMEHIATILTEVADTTDVIVYEPKLDKRGTYYKTLKKETDFIEYTELDPAALAAWAVQYVTERGGALQTTDARLLANQTGGNQQLLSSELDKLLAYDKHITRSTIELLTEPLPQSTVFELLDAAFAGKAVRAFELYREQRALRIEPQALLAMIVWQVHILAVVKAGMLHNIPADQLAKTAKLNPFVIRKSQGLVRQRSLVSIKTMVSDLLVLDMQLKRSAVDADEALQLFLLRLADT